MNKLNKIFGAALIAVSSQVMAGDCPSLSGRYTIGAGDGYDFSSINDATNALKCGGVSGPVTFKIAKGNYNERVVISSIPGTSMYNRVSFESATGNNADVVITYSTSDATMVLNGISYVSFENITIDHKSATYGNCMRVDGKSSNLTFKSVSFDGVESARTGANNSTIYFTSSAPKNVISFEDCEINNGSNGITKGGASADERDTKTSITGTLFFNQYENGLALSNEDAPVISNNVISSLTAYNYFKGINLENVSNNVIVSNNIINTTTGSIGLAMHNCVAAATNMGQINNNSIAVGGKSDAYGIYLNGTTDNQVFNFNRVKLSIAGTQKATQAYYKNAVTGNNVNMMNNICYDLKGGGYTIIGNSYKDFFNQLPAQSNPTLSVSANGIMIEKASPIK
jgi:hypothetical protein